MNWPHTKREIEKPRTQTQQRAELGALATQHADALRRVDDTLTYMGHANAYDPLMASTYDSRILTDVKNAAEALRRIGRWLRKEDL